MGSEPGFFWLISCSILHSSTFCIVCFIYINTSKHNIKAIHEVFIRMSSVPNSNVEDLTVNYEENGVLIVKELDKVILSKGAWATVMFRYQQWEGNKSAYGADKYVIRRYRKLNGEYKQQSKFVISSKAQAEKIIESLTAWTKDAEE